MQVPKKLNFKTINVSALEFLCILSLVAIGQNFDFPLLIPIFPIEVFALIILPSRTIKVWAAVAIVLTHAFRYIALAFGYPSLLAALKVGFENTGEASTDQYFYFFAFSAACLAFCATAFLASKISIIKIKPITALSITVLMSLTAFASENAVYRYNIVGSTIQYALHSSTEAKDNTSLPLNYSGEIKFSPAKNDKYLILIESFGRPYSTNLESIIKNHFTNKSNYKFEWKKIDVGGTVSGEFRELCDVKIAHSTIVESFWDKHKCLPNIYKNLGYITKATHAGPRDIFNRPFYYNEFGFDEYVAGKDLAHLTRCGGGWKGAACDIDVVIQLKNSKNINRPSFQYFLSINTHHPYKLTTNAKLAECDEFDIDKNGCILLSNIQALLDQIAKFSTNNPGEYILVGDHAPPLLEKYFHRNYVPAIYFESR